MGTLVRVLTWCLFVLAVIWGFWSTTIFLGAASAFDVAFPGARAERLSTWLNVAGIIQFLVVTTGPAVLLGGALLADWLWNGTVGHEMSRKSGSSAADRNQDEDHLRGLVHLFLTAPRTKEGSPEGDAYQEAAWVVGDTARSDPATCWRIIKLACDEHLSDEDYAYLSAGLFENLLAAHGEQLIDRIEAFARQNARMRFLLATVWKGGMADATWDRVSSLRGRLNITPL